MSDMRDIINLIENADNLEHNKIDEGNAPMSDASKNLGGNIPPNENATATKKVVIAVAEDVVKNICTKINFVKDELKSDIASLKSELKSDLASVKDDLALVKDDLALVKDDITSVKDDIGLLLKNFGLNPTRNKE